MTSLSSRDNADGGTNGPETVTLHNTLTNSQHDYLVAINDFEYDSNNAQDFYNSMSSIHVLNQLQSDDINMVGRSGSSASDDYFFFGCLKISTGMMVSIFTNILSSLILDGTYQFMPIQGVFFNGEDDSKWILMRNTYCPN